MINGSMEFLLPFLLYFIFNLPPSSSNAIHGCPKHCNGISIPFPFGIGPGCAFSGFQVTCDPHPLLSGTHIRILNFSNGELRVDSTPFIATACVSGANRSLARISLPTHGPFTVSGPGNSFVAVGCNTVAVLSDDGGTFTGGCMSHCASPENVSGTGPGGGCSGGGCCEAAIPSGRKDMTLATGSLFGYANVSEFNNCSYAFVVERGGYVFEKKDLMEFPWRARIAMRLEWAMRGEGSCGENGYSVPSVRGSGYLCNCLHGFSGNSYLNGSNGCQDIDECVDEETNPCVVGARCSNKIPGFECRCPFGSTGDGTKHGSGCTRIFPIVEAVLGISVAIGIMFLFGLWFYFAVKQRTLIKLKEQYFRQNGGLLLKQLVSNLEGADCTRIFSPEELEHATSNYNSSRIIGSGGYGTVYKGVLDDGTVVAIKKSKVMDQLQIDQFINEVVILTQINHRNVVKLIGCCLETQVPLLVYEFISNGTLHDHIHENNPIILIGWNDRLRIAIETAEALAYLHSAASMPVFHRDVKSSNILLDDNFTAKVSDFGISRLVPLDQTQVPTLVQGTFGYLDPEYFQTSQLTSKSDVYSFGVVLVELLTGEKPLSSERSKEDSNLAMYFLSSLKCKDLREFVDKDVMREGNVEQVKAVAELARKCLLLRGDKRPSMKEVAQELLLISSLVRHERDEKIDQKNKRSLAILYQQESLPLNMSMAFDLAR